MVRCKSLFIFMATVFTLAMSSHLAQADQKQACAILFTSLRQSYEMQQLQKHLSPKTNVPSVFERLRNTLRTFATGRVSQAELNRKFGKNWEDLLAKGKFEADFTQLKDSELKTIIAYIQKNKRAFEGISWTIDLSGNRDLSVSAIKELLQSSIIIHELNLAVLTADMSSIISSLVAYQPKVRKLNLDFITDADLNMLSHLRELREIDFGDTIVTSSLATRLRFALHRLLDFLVSPFWSNDSPNLRFLRAHMFHFNNFVSLSGLQRFIDSQTKIVFGPKGGEKAFNPYLKKITLPKLTDAAVANELAEKFRVYLVDENLQQKKVSEAAKQLSIAYGGRPKVTITSVYDGDSGSFITLSEKSYRIIGIDTFEVGTKDKYETKLADAAKNFATYLISEAEHVRLLMEQDGEARGRVLTDLLIYNNGEYKLLSQELVTHGLAFYYDGASNRSANRETLGIEAKTYYNANKDFIEHWAGRVISF